MSNRAIKTLHRAEDLLLALLAIAFVALAGAQVGVRFFADGGLLWADSVLKSMVLWLVMLGALAAARDDKHLGMDALLHFLRPTAKRIAIMISMAAACFACVMMYKFSLHFVQLERESPSDAHSAIAAWKVLSILPIAFAGMALRFAWKATSVWWTELHDQFSQLPGESGNPR
jgi:TRAP-type C4-dicarboxylate transport system permease small subunit